jgi:transcription initiation factor TFIID subunit 8
MPGIIYPSSASSVGAVAGMKRPHHAEAIPTYGQAHPKKQKVTHQLHHMQPVQHIADPISAETGDFGDCKDFFDQQLRRAIAIQCKAMGFESARPDALEEFRGLVDSCTASSIVQYAHVSAHIERPG